MSDRAQLAFKARKKCVGRMLGACGLKTEESESCRKQRITQDSRLPELTSFQPISSLPGREYSLQGPDFTAF